MSNVNKDAIHISGSGIYMVESSDCVYRVREGRVLVYILPIPEQGMRNRFFLLEAIKGELIPGLAYDSNTLGRWRFGFVAVGNAWLESIEDIDKNLLLKVRRDFAIRAGVELGDLNSFETEFIEHYNLFYVREEANIYKSTREQGRTTEQSLNLIRNVFFTRRHNIQAAIGVSGNALYDCTALLCSKEKINIAPLIKITKCAGKRFTINDIARLSHFTVREIQLPEKWYKLDCGNFIGFEKETQEPVFVEASGYRKYRYYDGKKNEINKVDAEFASRLSSQAVMFYRPFPDEKITLRKLIAFGLHKAYISDWVRFVVLSILGVIIGLFIPYLNELMYDIYIPFSDMESLIQFGAMILSFAIGNIGFTTVKNLSVFRAMNSMEYAVQSAVIDRVFNLPESFFRKYETADLGIRTLNITRVFNIVSEVFFKGAISAVLSIAYLFAMISYSSELLPWAIFLLILSLATFFVIGIKQIHYERLKIEIDQKTNSDLFQYIKGIEKLRSSASEGRAIYQYLYGFTESRKLNIKKEKLTVVTEIFLDTVQVLSLIGFYCMMGTQNLDLSIGSFMGFIAAYGAFQAALFEFVEGILVLNQVYPTYEMAKQILETLPENTCDAEMPEELLGEIEINNITFSYDDNEVPVLQGVTLHINSGEYVAIVGSSGSGKSTLIKILLGFEKPQLGRIYYDGQDMEELDKRELRRKFGVVLQSGGLVNGNIYDNITITHPNCDMSRVTEVIRKVGLENDIKEMPMGLFTMINEEAGTLSGGQAQRILIARALLDNPKIILMDEATSALDNKTQRIVLDTLEKLDATKIVIAHRLSTVINCDRIIVMDSGEIVEEGTYEELMVRKGRFYEMASRQMA